MLPNSISLPHFLAHFSENLRNNKRFCFILGAGASASSEIPTGKTLVEQWKTEIISRDEANWQNWVQQKNIDESNLDTHYPEIFDKRFELSKKDGFAFLEKTMEGKEPSCGYSVLAQILAKGVHNVVITTNFDSLTEDALFIYTQKKPLVIGHASLAGFISSTLTRPLIIKIHHDLFLSPKNSPVDVSCLDENFSHNLHEIFKYYTPLVIGYGGNDGSLMKFLSELPKLEDGLFWFYREKNQPSQRIIDLVEKVSGHFVPITGFDQLMIQIGDKLQLQKMDTEIEKIAKTRADNYREQYKKINTNIAETNPETKQALSNMVNRSEQTWWTYELLAQAETDPQKIKEIYLKGLEEFPDRSELLNNYAIFLSEKFSDYKQAFEFYKKAIEINPGDYEVYNNWGNNLGNLAITKKGAEAEKLFNKAFEKYRKAIELKPNFCTAFLNWGTDLRNLSNTKSNPAEASLLLNQAIEKLQKAFDLGGNCYNLACNHALLNNKTRALHYLEISLQNKEENIPYIKADPDWKNYLDDPDFNNLLDKYTEQ